MKEIFRRRRASETAQIAPAEDEKVTENTENNENTENTDNAEEAIPTFVEGGVTFAKLISAADNGEESVIESILIGAGIPYVVKENTTDSWMRVFMGFCTTGVDFYVPEHLLDDATELIAGEDAVELTEEELAALEAEAETIGEDEDA